VRTSDDAGQPVGGYRRRALERTETQLMLLEQLGKLGLDGVLVRRSLLS
jgi:hypothetical protein